LRVIIIRVSSREAVALGAILLVVALSAAISVDVVRTGFGIKGDEATYVAMGLSAAYDRDLTYERRDLERFFGFYKSGPDGIFLKRGREIRARIDATPPFLHIRQTPDRRLDRLYFGKALVYGIVSAPFVRLFGLNGFLVLHVLLLFGAGVCGYRFLAATSRPGPALVFTLAFIGASCVPVYAVLIAPEILNFSLVMCAYFCWLYKEVTPEKQGFLRSGRSDYLAAALLSVATYSNPRHALLAAPIVMWFWWRRRWSDGLKVGAAFVALTVLLFAATAFNTGEFNYQGGDRKSFSLGAYPFDGAQPDPWQVAGAEKSTNDADADNVFRDFPNRFSHNVWYFLVGRHFGFVPYFFPGVVGVVLWLLSSERTRPWRIFTLATVCASAVALLVFAPFTWSGGGGPPGNRYFMSVYPALFFVTPQLTSFAPGLLAWAGGALFTAKMLMNPFVAAKHPSETTERGFARRLPVELTMANDLPIMLETGRAHAWFSDVLMYFLDEHAHTPEKVDADGHEGVWIAGNGRADILVRSEWPIDHLQITAQSPIKTTFIVSMGGQESGVTLEPDRPITFDVPAEGVRDLRSYAYLLRAQSTEGFTPHLREPGNPDRRNLGVRIQFTAVPKRTQSRREPAAVGPRSATVAVRLPK
jgi:hypothetical protein